MKDPRIKQLAKNLLNYSVKVKKGETVIIEASARAVDLVVELVKQTYEIGAYPLVRLGDSTVTREILMGMTDTLAKKMCKYALPMFEEADAYIGVSSSRNAFETADVPPENKKVYTKHYGKPIHIETRVAKGRWVILHYPNRALAQSAQTSLEAFEDFCFDVCTMDYAKMHEAMLPLKALMERTDRVRITAKDTELNFSIKGQPAKICSGECNIPDGEIYTSPLRTSMNGKIRFNTSSTRSGNIHNDIRLEFKDGKVIEATSSNTDALLHEIDSDEGARYLGEFAFGVNPFIKKPMNDTLFDEKIGGSIHFALGNSYDDCPNGNHSQIHWDIVLLGKGCEIYFDDVLIRKDGKFVLPELQGLENLK